MPFDPVAFTPAALLQPYAPPSPEAFWKASPAERRIMLAELLEHEDKLPLKWAFAFVINQCKTAGCALGSARELWGYKVMPDDFATHRRDIDDMQDIFGYIDFALYDDNPESVTPAMVAAKLRAYQE